MRHYAPVWVLHTFASIFQQLINNFAKYASHVSGIGGCYRNKLSARKSLDAHPYTHLMLAT